MARQSTTPVQYERTIRTDAGGFRSSGRAGVVCPIDYIPLLPGDGCSGRFAVKFKLAEMPLPLENKVQANVQAWFVPKLAHPEFSSHAELMHSMAGKPIKALGQADRDPPPFFTEVSGANLTTVAASDFFKTLGLHVPTGVPINADLLDAFTVIYNFRLAAHSNALAEDERRKYFAEDAAEAGSLPRAFWPSDRTTGIVPDYERALVVGSLDLDIAAGQLPVSGIGVETGNVGAGASLTRKDTDGVSYTELSWLVEAPGQAIAAADTRLVIKKNAAGLWPMINAEMAGQTIATTLAGIDKARTTQAFAKLRTAYAGNDTTGFDNDDVLVALMMQGLPVPQDAFKRPWLLDSARVDINFAQRFSTTAGDLEESVSVGMGQAALRLNVPVQDTGGTIIITAEVLPERLYERQSDEWLHCLSFNDLPNALRDVQREEPVDIVLNRRIDAKHTTPGGQYGFEPMNNKWNRSSVRLGGDFYQATPGTPYVGPRSRVWQIDVVNPTFSSSHFLAPSPFPHNVFSLSEGSAFNFVSQHIVQINGLTQIGDPLVENNDDYDAVKDIGTVIEE